MDWVCARFWLSVVFFEFLVMYTLVNVREAAINDSMEIWRLIWLMIEIMQHMFFDHSVIGTWCVAPFVFAFQCERWFVVFWLDFCRNRVRWNVDDVHIWWTVLAVGGGTVLWPSVFLCWKWCSQLPVLSLCHEYLLVFFGTDMVDGSRVEDVQCRRWNFVRRLMWSSNFVNGRGMMDVSVAVCWWCVAAFFCCQVAECTRFPQSTTEAPQEIFFRQRILILRQILVVRCCLRFQFCIVVNMHEAFDSSKVCWFGWWLKFCNRCFGSQCHCITWCDAHQ